MKRLRHSTTDSQKAVLFVEMPPLQLFYSGKMKNYFSLKALKRHQRNLKISNVAELLPEIRSIPEKWHICI